ncbi:unnamed protein product [Ambrosiozyma monospora]|uniref:Unnamed protein product n=1 Tax=Ambrosiozyma monospora TaxID=43982 RepID=A0A9W7DEW4_AMBMO|nr:unnamed protein product [Ambrosiozyma monospora]
MTSTKHKRTPLSEITKRLKNSTDENTASIFNNALFDKTKTKQPQQPQPHDSRRSKDHFQLQHIASNNHQKHQIPNAKLLDSIYRKFNKQEKINSSPNLIARITKPQNYTKGDRLSILNPQSSEFKIYRDSTENSITQTSITVKKRRPKKKIHEVTVSNPRSHLMGSQPEEGKTIISITRDLVDDDKLRKPLSSQLEQQLTHIKTMDFVLNYDQPVKSIESSQDDSEAYTIHSMVDFGQTFKIVTLKTDVGDAIVKSFSNDKKNTIIVGLMLIKDSCWINLKLGNRILLGNDFFKMDWMGKELRFYYRWFKLM